LSQLLNVLPIPAGASKRDWLLPRLLQQPLIPVLAVSRDYPLSNQGITSSMVTEVALDAEAYPVVQIIPQMSVKLLRKEVVGGTGWPAAKDATRMLLIDRFPPQVISRSAQTCQGGRSFSF